MVCLLYSVVRFFRYLYPEPEFVNLFKEPMNRFPTWRIGPTALFDVPARLITLAGGIDSLESSPELHKRLQIRDLLIY
jgi:hypothetical protein